MSRLLIFESESDGHRARYITSLANYAYEHPEICEIIFAIPAALVARIDSSLADKLGRAGYPVSLRLLTKAELAAVSPSLNKVSRSLSLWNSALRIAGEVGARNLHFLFADDVFIASAIARRHAGVSISGIYFRPSMPYPEYWSGVKGYARQTVKDRLVARFLGRKDVRNLFSLDPYFRPFAVTRYRHADKVVTLPEPYDPPVGGTTQKISGNRLGLLFFGVLDGRKGIVQLFDSFDLLSSEELNRIDIRIIGHGELAGFIDSRIDGLRRRGATASFINGFISEGEIDEAVARSDVVLAPYINHVGSSSVVLTAAHFRKPLIAPNIGLVGRQVSEFRTGSTVDTSSPAAIAAAIRRMLSEARSFLVEGKPPDYDGLVAGHGSREFAQTILSLEAAK
jgi:glycosyltransferase involved in cell wall biosynthesis